MEQLLKSASESGLGQFVIFIAVLLFIGDKIVFWLEKFKNKKNGNGGNNTGLLTEAFINQTNSNTKLGHVLELVAEVSKANGATLKNIEKFQEASRENVSTLKNIDRNLYDQKIKYDIDREQAQKFYDNFNAHVKEMNKNHCNYRPE